MVSYTLAIFSKLNIFSRNNCPWRNPSNWTPSPPSDILKHDLLNNFFILLYHRTIKLSHVTRDDWIDLKQLCVDWYFPTQTAIIIRKFCKLQFWQLPPMQQHLIKSLPVQQILRQQNQKEEHWQWICLIQVKDSEEEKKNLHQGWLNLDKGYCYIFTLLYFDFTSFSLQLLNHLVPRTHGHTHSHHYDLFTSLSLTH